MFALNAECGERENHARDLAQHFDGWRVHVFRRGTAWWCGVAPEDLADADAAALTAAGRQLYWLLRTAPAVYRYALAGTDRFLAYAELMSGDDLTVVDGLVVSEDIWRATGGRLEYSAFAPGYRWIPYRGESR